VLDIAPEEGRHEEVALVGSRHALGDVAGDEELGPEG
jgi:hypothetical protein